MTRRGLVEDMGAANWANRCCLRTQCCLSYPRERAVTSTFNSQKGNVMSAVVESDELSSRKNLTTVIYALYAASVLVAITFFVAIVLNYVKKSDVAGTFLESHFLWQIRTFWFSLLWAGLGSILTFIGIGWVILAAGFFWFVYRIVKGWLRLADNRPMYVD